MPRQVTPLTNTQIRAARPREKEFNLADGHGLYLKVTPKGSKLWTFNYQTPIQKKRTNISLGSYPSVSLARAREEREEIRSLLSKNIDPKNAKKQKEAELHIAQSNTLEAVAERWFKIKSGDITADYAMDIWNSLENHVFPFLGSKPIGQISPRDVIEILEPLQDRGKLELVKRICQRLNMVMDYAVFSDLIVDNRIVRVGRAFKNPKKEHLPTIKPTELPELVNAIKDASIRPVTQFLMLWQLHTMVRPSEAAHTRWDEIDFDLRVWSIPSERMKKKREHVVPLSTHAIEILESIKPLSGNREFVFPSMRNPREPANSATVNMALRRMGFKGRLVSHGFRALASTALNEHGFDVDLIETALAHQDKNATRAAYNRTDFLERRREMMSWWSSKIDSV